MRAQDTRARMDVVARVVLRLRELIQRVGLVHGSERDDRRALPGRELFVAGRSRQLGESLMRRGVERIDEHRAIERFRRSLRVSELLEQLGQSGQRFEFRLRERRELRQHIGFVAIVVLLRVGRGEERVRAILAAILGEQRTRVFENWNCFVDLVVLEHGLAGH